MKPANGDLLMTLTRSILAIALVALAQHALVREVRAQAASAPDLEAILANPKIVKTLADIKGR
jgi:tripeptide aminopeptidase